MPQVDNTKAFETRKIIDAGIPKNISASDLAKLQSKWDEQARVRREAVERETAIPINPSKIIRFELRKFGRHWNAYLVENKRSTALMPTPSLLSSAMEAMEESIVDQASR